MPTINSPTPDATTVSKGKLQLSGGLRGTAASPQLAAGTIVQRVSSVTGALATGTTVLPTDDTIPQQTEGDQYMSVTVTPQSASNKLFIEVKAQVSHSGSIVDIAGALFQDANANALSGAFFTQAGTTYKGVLSLAYEMTAGTTSATTFKFRAGGGGSGTLTFNGGSGARLLGGVMSSYITVTETAV